MSKELTIKLDGKLLKKLDKNGLKNKNVIAEALNQFFENKEQDDATVSTLKESVQTLEKKKESLEIDNVCLLQENKKLQGRINDLVQMYPSAVALLGKTTESRQIKKNKWIFKR
jgi:hypothetical protein